VDDFKLPNTSVICYRVDAQLVGSAQGIRVTKSPASIASCAKCSRAAQPQSLLRAYVARSALLRQRVSSRLPLRLCCAGSAASQVLSPRWCLRGPILTRCAPMKPRSNARAPCLLQCAALCATQSARLLRKCPTGIATQKCLTGTAALAASLLAARCV